MMELTYRSIACKIEFSIYEPALLVLPQIMSHTHVVACHAMITELVTYTYVYVYSYIWPGWYKIVANTIK